MTTAAVVIAWPRGHSHTMLAVAAMLCAAPFLPSVSAAGKKNEVCSEACFVWFRTMMYCVDAEALWMQSG